MFFRIAGRFTLPNPRGKNLPQPKKFKFACLAPKTCEVKEGLYSFYNGTSFLSDHLLEVAAL